MSKLKVKQLGANNCRWLNISRLEQQILRPWESGLQMQALFHTKVRLDS